MTVAGFSHQKVRSSEKCLSLGLGIIFFAFILFVVVINISEDSSVLKERIACRLLEIFAEDCTLACGKV